MDEIELRRKLSDRTFEAGLKLMDKGAIQEIVKLSDSAYYARVKDAGTKIVLFRDREGDFNAMRLLEEGYGLQALRRGVPDPYRIQSQR